MNSFPKLSQDLTAVLPGSHRPSRQAPGLDILVWVECFSILLAVLAVKHPEWVPDFTEIHSVCKPEF